ncbi:hypothetical protein D3C80_842970 [compost metagenome]
MQQIIDKYPSKTTFVFDLDNTIFPSKDYDLQVYYLFGEFMEYTQPGIQEGKRILNYLAQKQGTTDRAELIDATIDHFAMDPMFKENFERLFRIARVPLKLLMYQQTLEFMQTLVADRKRLFILTAGDPEEQLNKIKQIEWNGLEKYLTVYFTEESEDKSVKTTLEKLSKEYNLTNDEMLLVGNESFKVSGIDLLLVGDLVKI